MDSKYDFRVMTGLRKRLNLTLEELARVSGLTYPTVASVENNKTLPSLRTLDAIAQALQISTKELIAMAESPLLQKQTAEKINFQELKEAVEEMKDSRFSSFKKANVIKLSLKEGQTANTKFIHEDSHEICYCLSGKVRLNIQNTSHDLKPDETAFFDSILEHSYTQVETGETMVILIPKFENLNILLQKKR